MKTLIDRYVAEAAGRVGGNTRHEVSREIRGMVDELVDARVARGEPAGEATERVLNELGNPRRVARDYAGDQRYLIGPTHYDEYTGLLRAMLTRVVPLVALVVFAVNVVSGDGSVGRIVGSALGETAWLVYTVGIQIVFWVTVAFVIMERSRRPEEAAAEVAATDDWTVADLPPLQPKRQISIVDALSGLGITVFVGFIFALVYRNGMAMYLGEDGRNASGDSVPFFNPGIPQAIAWTVVGLLVADAVLEIVKYAVGFWTRAVTGVQLAVSVLWIVVAMWVIGQWDLVNPGITEVVSDDVADVFIGNWFELSVLATVLVASAIDIWDAVRGHLAWREPDDGWTV